MGCRGACWLAGADFGRGWSAQQLQQAVLGEALYQTATSSTETNATHHARHSTLNTTQISGKPEHFYYGRPEDSNITRPVYTASSSNPGADLAAEYAAAFAAAATLYKSLGEGGYAGRLIARARQAYGFALKYQSKCVGDAGGWTVDDGDRWLRVW